MVLPGKQHQNSHLPMKINPVGYNENKLTIAKTIFSFKSVTIII